MNARAAASGIIVALIGVGCDGGTLAGLADGSLGERGTDGSANTRDAATPQRGGNGGNGGNGTPGDGGGGTDVGPVRDADPGGGGTNSPGAIVGIRFDWSTYRYLAPGSDNWPLTWCEDGHQYTSWGDGGGFGGTNSSGRVSLGFARIEGDYPSFTPKNVWGGHQPEDDVSATFTGKSTSMICIGGKLYAWRSDGSDTGSFDWKQLVRSNNKGASWQEDAFPKSRLDGCTGCPGLPYTIQFGKNYAANGDGYVYTYTIRIDNPNQWEVQKPGVVWLARAPAAGEAWADLENWEWVTAIDSDNKPTWGALNDRAAVLTDPDGMMRGSALYVPGLDRYLMATNHTARNKGNLAIWEAPEPWGPWTRVLHENGWPGGDAGAPSSGTLARTFAFGNFSPKWLSTDGRSCVFVWFRPDAWNSVACTLETAPAR